MKLKDQLLQDIKTAMKAKDSLSLSSLRFLNAQIKNKEIESRPNELKEEEVLSVVKKAVKQRKESIAQYQQAGREDLVKQEQSELDIIEKYLPEMMPEAQVLSLVNKAVEELQAQSMKDMGKVMKAVLDQAKGMADSSLVSKLVKDKLS